MNLRVRAAPGG